MYQSSEILHNQWWDPFCGANLQKYEAARKEEGSGSVPFRPNRVYEDVMNHDTSSTDTGASLCASDCEMSPQSSLEYTGHSLPERILLEYEINHNPWDYTSDNIIQTANSEQLCFDTQFYSSGNQQRPENYPWALDLSMKNTTHLDESNTAKVQLLCGCETVSDFANQYSNINNECPENRDFMSTSVQNESAMPIYDWSTSNNGIIELMSNENNNEVMKIHRNIFGNETTHYSEVLDLSIPRNMEIERVMPKPERKMKMEIIMDDIVDVETDGILPEDLPDLRFSDVKKTIPLRKTKERNEKWIYSVRRRMLKVSTIKKMFKIYNVHDFVIITHAKTASAPEQTKTHTMFGLEEANMNDITLLYGGRGLKNPLRSNIPTFSNHLNLEKKYVCIYCEKEFKNSKVLSRHYTQHTTFRKCFCIVCWRGFYDAYDLKRHLKTHQEIKVFYCELCESVYTQNITKETHYRNIHRHYFSVA